MQEHIRRDALPKTRHKRCYINLPRGLASIEPQKLRIFAELFNRHDRQGASLSPKGRRGVQLDPQKTSE